MSAMRLAIVDDRVTAAVGDESPDDAGEANVEASADELRWVLAVEGKPTGDGRIFQPGSITFAEFPFPLMATDKTSFGHDGAQLVGHFVRGGMEGDEAVAYSTFIDSNDEGVINLQRLIREGSLPGVSVDLDDVEGEFIIKLGEVDELPEGTTEVVIPFGGDEEITSITRGRIRAATAVPIPAFVEARQEPEMIAASLMSGEMTLVRRRALIAAPGDWSGVVVVAVPSDPAALTVDGGLAADELHVTIGYYGDAENVSEETLMALRAYIDSAGGASFTAEVGGVARLGKDDPQAVALLLNSEALEQLRDGVDDAAELPEGGYPHFVPHLTLGYGIDIPAPDATPTQVAFDRVALWAGDERYEAAGDGERPAEDDTEADAGDGGEVTDAVVAAITAPDAPPAAWFDNPGLTGPTPMTVTDDGRVYGHLATWDSCHVGFQNECVLAPRSLTNYGAFTTGEIITEDGSRRRVGQITTGSGHASMSATARTAKEHYDHTGWSAADVAAGEDRHGIWIAGAVRPGLSTAALREFMAADISGDWRRIDGSLELVGIASVNVPGFQKSPAVQSRVAAGAVQAMVATAHRPCDDLDGTSTAPDRDIAARIAFSIGRHPDQLAAQRDALAERMGRTIEARRAELAARMGR
jgi:hypothetical protein